MEATIGFAPYSGPLADGLFVLGSIPIAVDSNLTPWGNRVRAEPAGTGNG